MSHRLYIMSSERRTSKLIYPEYENSAAGEIESFQIRHIRAALSDWQVSGMIRLYVGLSSKVDFRSGHMHLCSCRSSDPVSISVR